MGVEVETPQAGPGAPADVLAFLIADVRGYSTFTRERGDAEAARLAMRFADLTRDAVAARGGRVVEVRGDEVLAVFSSAMQAVRAAVELQATLGEESAADPSLPLPVGVGIDVGEAVPVEGGYRGAALNLAARLCARAAAGQVLVSAAVRDQVAEFELGVFEERGEAELKGFESPVAIFEVVSSVGRLETTPRTASPSQLPPALDVETPLVGRDHEIAWLRGTWRAARRGRGRVVFVAGPSGIGKTSLAAVLARHVAAQGYRVRYSEVGGTALARVSVAIQEAGSAHSPLLVVLDDLGVTGELAGAALGEAFETIETRPVLVVGLTENIDSVAPLAPVVERAGSRGDGHRQLVPLTTAEVTEVARVYSGDDAGEVPVESIVRSSGGVPAKVHELLDAWLRDESTRRLAASAGWLASVRDRRGADIEFANNAIELRLRRIYAPGSTSTEVGVECPYMGLAAFGATDAERFFGRERLVGELAARTVETGLLALVGPSGSGKSSLVSAGLLPSLAAGLLPGSGRWPAVTIRPGARPMMEFPADALARADPLRRLVLAVDQFEEVFTLCADETERRVFLDAVVDAAATPERVVVVVSVRGDFLDRIAGYPALAELVSANQVLIAPMRSEEYRRAIELPARRFGVRVESALAEALVDEAIDQPGALPLLSTALVELWSQRDDGWVRESAYRATGGLHGAVARLAEASYGQLSEPERQTTKHVFMRLAGDGDGDAVTRRRVPASEFDVDGDPHTAAVLDRFVHDRLLTRDAETVEVAHEALLREWPRLRDWLQEDVQGRLLHRHLTESAALWQENDRRAGDLYRAERLSAVLEWSGHSGVQMNTLEREFLSASQVASTRALRRLRAGIAVLAVLLVAALIGGVVAVSQRRSAQHEAAAARQQAQIAIGQRVGAQAASEPDMSRSLLLAVQSVVLAPSSATSSDLVKALVRARSAVTVFHAGDRLLGIAVSPDGKVIAASGSNGGVWMYDTRSGQQLGAPIQPAHDRVSGPELAFAPDSTTLAIFGGAQGKALLYLADARTHRHIATIPPGDISNFESVAFSPGGHLLVAVADVTSGQGRAAAGHELAEWHLPDMHPVGKPQPLAAGDTSVMFAPDGALLTVSKNGVGIWHARPLRHVAAYPRPAGDTALSPDGRTLAIMSHRRITFLDLGTGRRRPGPHLQPGAPTDLLYTTDGRSLVGINARALVQINIHTGAVTTVGRERELRADAVAADGSGVYTAGLDQTAVHWSLNGGRFSPSLTYPPPGKLALGLFVSSRDVAATVDANAGAAQLWNLRTRTPIGGPISPGPGGLGWAAFSPDGRTLAMANATTGHIQLWDIATHRVTQRLIPPHPLSTDGLIYSPNGRFIASGTAVTINPITSKHGYITVWELPSGRVVDRFHQPGDQAVSTVAFSPDSRRIVSVGGRGTVAVWDVPRHSRLRAWRTTDDLTLDAVFNPAGNTIATGGFGGGLTTIWNSSTGRQLPPPLPGAGKVYPAGYYDQGRGLVVARDGQVELWDVPSRSLIATLPTGGGLPGAVVTPDGRHVATTSTTGSLTIWPVAVQRWIADACLIANRRLTSNEWHAYLPGLPYQPACK